MSPRSWMIGTLLLLPMCIGAGCASATADRSMASTDAATATETEEAAETPPPAQKKFPPLPFKKKRNPFIDGDKTASAELAETEAGETEIESAVVQADRDVDADATAEAAAIEQIGGTSSGRDATSSVSHDAELLKRINSELKDLPAKERAELFHNLKSLDPAMVDQVLKMRRMSRNITQQTTSAPVPVDGGGYSLDSPNETPTEPRSGLGNGNPWGSSNAPKTETLALGESKPIEPPPRREPQLPQITPDVGRVPPVISADDTAESSAPAGIDFGELTPEAISENSRSADAKAIVFPPELAGGPDSGVITVSSGDERPPRGGKASIDSLIAVTEQELATMALGTTPDEQRKFVEKHVFLRMLYWLGKQQERALQPIPGIDPADQEFWQQVFWAMTNYFDAQTIPDEADRAAQTLVQLRAAVQRLQEKAKLEIHNVAFCHKISSFGNYERFNKDEFTPGQPVLLYGEMVNFKSEPTADGQYRTIMKSTLEIYRAGPQGQLVERIPFGATEDLCRQPRTDYYHTYEFTIPPRITLGPHVLKLVVEDQLSQKIATYSINFMVK